jgi:6-phosphogluconolactonase (cycloisomerase 2 family)
MVSQFETNVYAASQGGDAVVAFTRDAGTGLLTFLETERRAGLTKGIKGASGIIDSAFGNYVFVTGRGDDAVAVFKRDFATGALDFLEVHDEVVPGANVLGSAEAVAVAYDLSGGVYVVGSDRTRW